MTATIKPEQLARWIRATSQAHRRSANDLAELVNSNRAKAQSTGTHISAYTYSIADVQYVADGFKSFLDTIDDLSDLITEMKE